MPQIHLPFFAEGMTPINSDLAFTKRDGRVTYFNGGQHPVFSHDEGDIATFRMITSQFCIDGVAKLVEISRAFGIPSVSVKRAVKRYREQGPAGFYKEPGRRGPAILKPPVLAEIQNLLDTGFSIPQTAEKLDLKANTLHKAVQDGRLRKPVASNVEGVKKN